MEQVKEDQDHLTYCSGYSDLPQGMDMERDLVDFFTDVIARREKNGWDGNSSVSVGPVLL